MCPNRAANRPATRLASATVMLSAVNLTLLMPAARHEHAGLFTQALPFLVIGLTLVLLYLAVRQMRTGRK